MKQINNIHFKYMLLLSAVFFINCDRELSDEAEFATHTNNPDIFIDGFSAGLDYNPFGDSKLDAFSVDTNTKFQGTAAMRIDVPAFGIGYAGANFPVSFPRDLSGYDALTFYAKATQAASINEIGFGINPENNNKYRVTLTELPLTTNWVKYVIPIPDASKLIEETGMLWYAEGARSAADEGGYTFWLDEIKFEKLGTLGNPTPKINGGIAKTETSFIGADLALNNFTQTFNLADGTNQTVSIAPSYFTFSSSNPNVAVANEAGVISVFSAGTTEISAILAGVKAEGTLTVESSGNFTLPNAPTQNAANVISLYSNAYTNLAGVNPDANYGGQTTQSSILNINGDNLISYTNLNYVGFEFQNPTADATDFGFLHLDVYTNSTTNSAFNIEIRDRGTNGELNTDVNTGNPIVDDKRIVFSIPAADVKVGEWMSIDIPLTGDLATQKANLAAIIFSGDIDFILDNVYIYK